MRAKPQWTTERAVQRADAIMTEECEHDEIRDVADCPWCFARVLAEERRRGEERVLRFARSLGETVLTKHYRAARRARVGRGR